MGAQLSVCIEAVSFATTGCTDPAADNYDPAAICDNGACSYCTAGQFTVIMSMTDTYGDGWNDNTYTITDLTTGALVAFGALDFAQNGDGSNVGTDIFCLDTGCYNLEIGGGEFIGEIEWSLDIQDSANIYVGGGEEFNQSFIIGAPSCDVSGCTDAICFNYNPYATVDDGSCLCPPENDLCDGAIAVTCGSVVTGSNTDATEDILGTICSEEVTGPGVWYQLDGDGSLHNINTCGSDIDTKILVFEGSCGALTCVGGNDDSCGFQSKFSWISDAGTDYFIYVTGFNTVTGDFELAITCAAPGCTDTDACNFNPLATIDDGSCLLPDGCTDSGACNYNAAALCDDDNCIFPGCTDSGACNYNFEAGCDDGSCEYMTCVGCTSPTACNYDETATIDDGSCASDAVWWIPETLSSGALFTCEQPVGYTLADPACFNVILSTNPNCLVDWDAACQAEYCTCTGACGCTDATACNFNPQANFDDGSCILPDGCTNPSACNYDPAATCDDGTCDIADSDQDGVLDCNDGCPLDANKTEPGICGCGTPDNDTDLDGLFDCEELELGTNPLLQDSDQDGLTDPLEVHVTQTNPLDPDTDGDGCDDASEIMFQCDDSPFNPDCPTDLNGDGAIDANDILDLIATYGTFCDAP